MIKVEEAIKNRTSQDFKNDLYIAQRAEKAVSAWIDTQNAYEKVIGVNEKGYDILCYTKDSKIKKVEVKRDFWIDKYKHSEKGRKATNNICIEVWSNFPAGNPGWIFYSDSDFIYYVGNENIYILSTSRLKVITSRLINIGQAKVIEPTLKEGVPDKIAKMSYSAHFNGNYKVRNLLVNKDWLSHTGCILRIIDREQSGFNKIAAVYEI